ncbi:MAG: Diaminohydroxyphosphoribosylaminopyrimidine deaminase / 5-amino-6-(5-phosphoribosylamino)uracil reductase, partial [uncultured Acetobacteraceae bacterium]
GLRQAAPQHGWTPRRNGVERAVGAAGRLRRSAPPAAARSPRRAVRALARAFERGGRLLRRGPVGADLGRAHRHAVRLLAVDRRGRRHPAHAPAPGALPRRGGGRRDGAARRPAADHARVRGPGPGAGGAGHRPAARPGPARLRGRRAADLAHLRGGRARTGPVGGGGGGAAAARAGRRRPRPAGAAARSGVARADAGVRGGRRRHREPLPRRRVPRPAARDGGAGAARLRHPGLHPAGGGAHRGRAAVRVDAAHAGRRRAVRHRARPRAPGGVRRV